MNVQPGSYYPGGGIPAIMLGGIDVTSQLQGGQIGANITLRDTTLPTDQAELDEFSQNMASRFATNGLALFTDPTGAVPRAAACRRRTAMSGSPAPSRSIRLCRPTPSLVRDGTRGRLRPALAPASPASSTRC